MIRRGPKFQVVTFTCVGLAIAGVGIKIAARFLPERQPNRLIIEYGKYVNTAARERVDWYPLSEEPFRIAQSKGKLILLEIGDMFSRPGRILRYNHLEEPEFYRLINSQFVGIKVDALESPALRELIDLNSDSYLRSSRLLVLVMDAQGNWVDESPYRPLATIGGATGMADWLFEVARRPVTDLAALSAAIEAVRQARERAAVSILAPSPLDESAANALFENVRKAFVAGRLLKGSWPVASTVFDLLSTAGETDTLVNLLLQLRESTMYDHVEGGFFSGATQPIFRKPTYGKLVSSNALLAASYARAGATENAPLFTDTARRLAAWVTLMKDSESGLFNSGVATDEFLEDGSPYYDWHPQDLPETVMNAVEIEADAGSPGPIRLKAVRNFEQAVSRERAAKLSEARLTLLGVARQATRPQIDSTTYADQNGMVIASLFVVGTQLGDRKLVGSAATAYAAAIRTFVQPFGDVLHAPQGGSRTTGYSGDYAWIARAAIENYLCTGSEAALVDAERITERMLELFADASGGIKSSLRSGLSFLGGSVECFGVADFNAPSTNAIAARNLYDLSQILQSERYREAASRVLDAFALFQSSVDLPSPGYVDAALRLYRPAILTRGIPQPQVNLTQQRYPTMLCAPMYVAGQDGYYLRVEGDLKGPMSLEAVVRWLQQLGVSAATPQTLQ